MGRKTNDGALTGLKQDRFRNSRFEIDQKREQQSSFGVSEKTFNTLGGPFEENRGHRLADDFIGRGEPGPFENGRLYNWNHRQGWDEYYIRSQRSDRNHGGSQMFHDLGHSGKGPKGYKRADSLIYEDVCSMLQASRDVDGTDIEVAVKEGCVYLNGCVNTRYEKKMAELEIENISGVRDVQNYLKINTVNTEIQ